MSQGPGTEPIPQLLRRQHAVISREQALACGLSPGALRHRLRPGGPWQVLVPGVYLASNGVVAPEHRDLAALLHAGRGSVITGPAALRRSGLRAPWDGTVHVLVPAGSRRIGTGFVRLSRTTRMPAQIGMAGEIRFAMTPRAVADTARMLRDLADVRGLVAGAIQRRACTLPELARELAEGPVGGSMRLRQVLTEVTDGIRSAAEGDFRDLLQRGHLPMPIFNARLYAGGTFLAMVDAWWPEAGVAAEVDSREWHFSPHDWQRTLDRHNRLSAHHIIVVHFTPSQILREPGSVLAAIRSALASPGRLSPEIRALPPAP